MWVNVQQNSFSSEMWFIKIQTFQKNEKKVNEKECYNEIRIEIFRFSFL